MMQPLFLNFLTHQYYFHPKVMFVINTDFMILLVLKMQLFAGNKGNHQTIINQK